MKPRNLQFPHWAFAIKDIKNSTCEVNNFRIFSLWVLLNYRNKHQLRYIYTISPINFCMPSLLSLSLCVCVSYNRLLNGNSWTECINTSVLTHSYSVRYSLYWSPKGQSRVKQWQVISLSVAGLMVNFIWLWCCHLVILHLVFCRIVNYPNFKHVLTILTHSTSFLLGTYSLYRRSSLCYV